MHSVSCPAVQLCGGTCAYYPCSIVYSLKGRKVSEEKQMVIPEIGKDGKCKCSCATPCPLGKRGTTYRCTKEELDEAGVSYTVEKEAEEFEVGQVVYQSPYYQPEFRESLPLIAKERHALVVISANENLAVVPLQLHGIDAGGKKVVSFSWLVQTEHLFHSWLDVLLDAKEQEMELAVKTKDSIRSLEDRIQSLLRTDKE